MISITGLDSLAGQLEDAQNALAALDEELGTVCFNPHDPASIEAAIQQVETTIDNRLGDYASNPIIRPLTDQMKKKYREGIIDQAAATRLAGGVAQ